MHHTNLIENGLQVFLGGGHGQAAQCIVCAEFEHKYVHGLLEYPFDAIFAVSGGLAAQPCVDAGIKQSE